MTGKPVVRAAYDLCAPTTATSTGSCAAGNAGVASGTSGTDGTLQFPGVYRGNSDQVAPKKKRRFFLWFFLAVQVLFIVWIIAGASSGAGQPSDCGTLDAQTCNAASDAGTAIGVALVIVFWCVVDFLLGVGYVIYRVARRP